jgi:predicted GIY-YIG superfamily endonuclease
MIKIYLLTDKNGIKYVGSTKNLPRRLAVHRSQPTSSGKLDFESIEVTILDECEEESRMKTEKNWINKIDCVNILKYNYKDLEYKRKRNKWIRSWGTETANNMFFITPNLFD